MKQQFLDLEKFVDPDRYKIKNLTQASFCSYNDRCNDPERCWSRGLLHPRFSSELGLCYFYLKGKCQKDNCEYLHVQWEHLRETLLCFKDADLLKDNFILEKERQNNFGLTIEESAKFKKYFQKELAYLDSQRADLQQEHQNLQLLERDLSKQKREQASIHKQLKDWQASLNREQQDLDGLRAQFEQQRHEYVGMIESLKAQLRQVQAPGGIENPFESHPVEQYGVNRQQQQQAAPEQNAFADEAFEYSDLNQPALPLMRKDSSTRTKQQRENDLKFLMDVFVNDEDSEIQLEPSDVHEFYAKYPDLQQCVEALVEFRNSLINQEDEFDEEEDYQEEAFRQDQVQNQRQQQHQSQVQPFWTEQRIRSFRRMFPSNKKLQKNDFKRIREKQHLLQEQIRKLDIELSQLFDFHQQDKRNNAIIDLFRKKKAQQAEVRKQFIREREVASNTLYYRINSTETQHDYIDLHGQTHKTAESLIKQIIPEVQKRLNSGVIQPNLGDGHNHYMRVLAGKGNHSRSGTGHGTLKFSVCKVLEKIPGIEFYKDLYGGVFHCRLQKGLLI